MNDGGDTDNRLSPLELGDSARHPIFGLKVSWALVQQKETINTRMKRSIMVELYMTVSKITIRLEFWKPFLSDCVMFSNGSL